MTLFITQLLGFHDSSTNTTTAAGSSWFSPSVPSEMALISQMKLTSDCTCSEQPLSLFSLKSPLYTGYDSHCFLLSLFRTLQRSHNSSATPPPHSEPSLTCVSTRRLGAPRVHRSPLSSCCIRASEKEQWRRHLIVSSSLLNTPNCFFTVFRRSRKIVLILKDLLDI